MASNNFNNSLEYIDNVSLGGRIPIDDDTAALWIFDGSEVNGMVKDWSSNENHLVPSQPLVYDYAPFSKVLSVNSGLSLTSLYPPAVYSGTEHCLEMYFSTNVEQPAAVHAPFDTVWSGMGAGYKAGFLLYSNQIDGDGYDRYMWFGRQGILNTSSNEYVLAPANIKLLWSSREPSRYHNENSPISGDPYYQQLYPKNWLGLAFNTTETSLYVNGNNVPTYFTGAFIPNLVSQYAPITFFPVAPLNACRNLAFIRISRRHRTSEEINSMLRYFSSASGYFKEAKFYSSPRGDFEISKLMSDGVKEIDEPLLYQPTTSLFEFTRSGVGLSQEDVVGSLTLVESGLSRYDYDELGGGLGIVLEDQCQNLFTYALQESDFTTEWGTYLIDGELNHDPTVAPVYGQYYGETTGDGFHYTNIDTTFTNSGVYTLSMFVQRTGTINNHYFDLSLSPHGGISNFNFVGVDVLDSHPYYSGVTWASNALRFHFAKGREYSKWNRLWVTFKPYMDHKTPYYMQVTQDNRTSITGNKDRWAIDCAQLETGALSSWFIDYVGNGIRGKDIMKFDFSNKIESQGTVMFDYHTYVTYSGIEGYANIANLGDEVIVTQSGQGFQARYFNEILSLTPDIVASTQARLAFTWNPTVCKFYRLDTEPDQMASGIGYAMLGNYIIPHSGSTYVGGTSFRLKNLRMFQRDLTLDELKLYD